MPFYKGVSRRVKAYLINTDGTENVSGSITATISKDGGAFAGATNTPTRIGSTGAVYLDLTSTETNCDVLGVKFVVSGAVPVMLDFYPEADFTSTVAGRIDAAISSLPSAAAIWAYLASSATTTGSLGKRIADFLTGDAYIRLGAPAGASVSADVASVMSRLGAPAGASVSADIASNLSAILNITTGTFLATDIPAIIERPDSGTESLIITLVIADETGAAADIDASGLPTVVLTDAAGTNQGGRLSAWTRIATGKYQSTYTSSATDGITRLRWEITATINSKVRRYVQSTEIVDTTAVSFTSTDRTNLAAIKAKTDNLPTDPASNTQVNTRLASSGYTPPDNTSIAAIKAKTDNLPADPASNTQVNTRLAASGYTAPDNTSIASILADTTNLKTRVPAALVGGRMDSSVGNMAANTLTASALATDAVTEIAGAVAASNSGFAVLGIKARLSGQANETYIEVVAGDDKNVAIFFEDPSGAPVPIPSNPVAAMLDAGGSTVGTAEISDTKITIGYLLVRLQVASNGNLPAVLRITFGGGAGGSFSHDIVIRARQ